MLDRAENYVNNSYFMLKLGSLMLFFNACVNSCYQDFDGNIFQCIQDFKLLKTV